jgi:hypothetical protein
LKILATVNAKALAAAAVCQAHDDVRYYLNGVYIVPDPDGGVQLVSTDGHRMLIITDPNGSCADKKGIILAADTSALTKMRQQGYQDVDVLQDTEMNLVFTRVIPLIGSSSKTYICNAEIKDGTFPKYEKVIPAKLPQKYAQKQVVFNGAYMQSFYTVAKILGVSGNAMSFVTGPDDLTKIMILFNKAHSGSVHARAVLMAMHFGDKPLEWLPSKEKAE